jgi:hypothetical protein
MKKPMRERDERVVRSARGFGVELSKRKTGEMGTGKNIILPPRRYRLKSLAVMLVDAERFAARPSGSDTRETNPRQMPNPD